MRILLACALSLGVAACGEEEIPAPAPAPEFLDLLCASFAGKTAAALAAEYGAENLREETVPGPEGELYEASVLFPDDPMRRLEIIWADGAARAHLTSVRVRDQSAWIGNNGLAIGDALARVESLNGAPFRLWGFGWDYGGWVSEWNGGLYAPANGCATHVRLQPRSDRGEASGDSEFISSDAAVRAADPVVTEFGLSFATR